MINVGGSFFVDVMIFISFLLKRSWQYERQALCHRRWNVIGKMLKLLDLLKREFRRPSMQRTLDDDRIGQKDGLMETVVVYRPLSASRNRHLDKLIVH